MSVEGELKPRRFELATGFLARIRGLLDPAVCNEGEVLVLAPCASIHTFGMRESIDVAFLDQKGCVLRAVQGLLPNRLLSCRGAACVLERRNQNAKSWYSSGETLGLGLFFRETGGRGV
jgi:uncharacterized membrane protein (UPF0127 family)